MCYINNTSCGLSSVQLTRCCEKHRLVQSTEYYIIIKYQDTMALRIVLLSVACSVVLAQRPFYAGIRPIGYPEIQSNIQLTNRFGEDLPIEARGDRNLINRLEAMPLDDRPFWYLNWRQYDQLRRNPQWYPQRPSSFATRFG